MNVFVSSFLQLSEGVTSSCQSKRRQSDYRYIWNQITLLVDESVPVLLLYNMAFCSYLESLESVLRCGSSSNDAPTSFPGSLSPRPQEREKRDPGCGWSRDLGDKPKPQGGLFLKKILSTVQQILSIHNFFSAFALYCTAT